jgi:hypothetical protein
LDVFITFMYFRFSSATIDVWILNVWGPIGVATMEYVVSSIDLAHSDTPHPAHSYYSVTRYAW